MEGFITCPSCGSSDIGRLYKLFNAIKKKEMEKSIKNIVEQDRLINLAKENNIDLLENLYAKSYEVDLSCESIFKMLDIPTDRVCCRMRLMTAINPLNL